MQRLDADVDDDGEASRLGARSGRASGGGRARGSRSSGRSRRARPRAGPRAGPRSTAAALPRRRRRIGEVAAHPRRLEREEGRVERHGHHGEPAPRRWRRCGRRPGGREDEERRQRDEDAEIGARAVDCRTARGGGSRRRSARPTMPFRTMMRTASMVSRASVGSGSPWSMTATITETSMMMTEMVSTTVPSGSPSRSATSRRVGARRRRTRASPRRSRRRGDEGDVASARRASRRRRCRGRASSAPARKAARSG